MVQESTTKSQLITMASNGQASLRCLELSHGIDLHDLKIEFASDGQVFSDHRSALAYANADMIVVRADVKYFAPERLSGILRHEIAHVIQKRMARHTQMTPRLSDAVYEIEAEVFRQSEVSQKIESLFSPDPHSGIRFFEEDGHYYTTYLAAALGGVPGSTAARIAFYSQLPDLIWELDAISVGIFLGMSGGEVRWSEAPIKYLRLLGDRPVPSLVSSKLPEYVMHLQKSYMPVVGGTLGRTPKLYEEENLLHPNFYKKTYISRFLREPDYSSFAQKKILQPRPYCLAIQKGLHSLTGRVASDEQNARLTRLSEYKILSKDALKLGLAIHAYGDSFAHTDNSSPPRMFFPIRGHSEEGHTPDEMKGRTKEWNTLFKTLVRFFSGVTKIKKPISDEELDQISVRIITLCEEGMKERRNEEFRDLIRAVNGAVDPYQPASMCDFWHHSIRKKFGSFALSTLDLDVAISCAEDWS